MKPLLAILSYQKANDMVMRHFPWWRKAGCDILGVGREDSTSLWPAVDDQFIGSIRVGKDSYVDGDNLIRLHLDVLKHCLTLEKYHEFILIEPDTLLLKEPPGVPFTFRATLKGGNSPGFLGSYFAHGPWRFPRHVAQRVVTCGERMLKVGLIERGFPDRFYGLLDDLYDIGFCNHAENYSQNRLDRPEFIQQAREAIKAGAWAVHGVKSPQELQAVTEGLV